MPPLFPLLLLLSPLLRQLSSCAAGTLFSKGGNSRCRLPCPLPNCLPVSKAARCRLPCPCCNRLGTMYVSVSTANCVACVLGGLGASLYLIHIYVSPLKKALQAFWLGGTLGMLYIMATQDVPAALFLAQTPSAVWLMGPLFASLTGALHRLRFCALVCKHVCCSGHVPLHCIPLACIIVNVPDKGINESSDFWMRA